MATEKEVKDALDFSADMCGETDNIYPYYHIRVLAEKVIELDGQSLSYANQAALAITRSDRMESDLRRLRDAGKALRDALAFECHKLGDCPREIDEWDALVSALPNVKDEPR